MSNEKNKLGDVTLEEIEALSKALSAGATSIDPITRALLDTFYRLGLSKRNLMKTHGAALQVEDLTLSDLTVQTFDSLKLKLWKNVRKKK